MFIDFFDTCKAKGLNITLSEWLTLMDALDKGLCGSSLSKFYYIARSILVKSETDFDKFDLAFEEYFKGIFSDDQITDRMLRWLDKPDMNEMLHEMDKNYLNSVESGAIDKNDVETKFKQRLKDQDSEHNGGAYWIGTMGTSQIS